MSLTDTHCHLDLPAFDADREAALERAREAGVLRLLVPALDLNSSRRIVQLAARESAVFAAVGVHPTEATGLEVGALDAVRDLAHNPKVVAVGEIGLDYYWVSEEDARARQRAVLERQLALAGQLGLPVILHMREAHDAEDGQCAHDLLEILRAWVDGLLLERHPLVSRPGVLHSFAGSLQTAHRAISMGFHLGVTGPVTFRNAAARRTVVSQIPLERILLETDSPFLSPAPRRGQRNEPAFVTHIADKIAEIQSRSVAEVARTTAGNAARVFAWGESV